MIVRDTRSTFGLFGVNKQKNYELGRSIDEKLRKVADALPKLDYYSFLDFLKNEIGVAADYKSESFPISEISWVCPDLPDFRFRATFRKRGNEADYDLTVEGNGKYLGFMTVRGKALGKIVVEAYDGPNYKATKNARTLKDAMKHFPTYFCPSDYM